MIEQRTLSTDEDTVDSNVANNLIIDNEFNNLEDDCTESDHLQQRNIYF